MRDYEKYLARQFKRGTSRQELNVSWLKKNELDLKRHVQELRENIANNWTTTGSELSRELRQFWPASRPQSPARINGGELVRSPGGGPINSKELVTGYALGLVGGVRSWVSCLFRLSSFSVLPLFSYKFSVVPLPHFSFPSDCEGEERQEGGNGGLRGWRGILNRPADRRKR